MGVQDRGAGSSQPVRQNLEDRRVQRAGGFIEGDTEPGEGSCHQPDHGLHHPHNIRDSWTPVHLPPLPLDNTKGILPQTHQRCPRGPPEFCSGEGWGGGTKDSPSRAVMDSPVTPVHPSLHWPAYLCLGWPPSLAALEPGPMVLLLGQQRDESVAVGQLQPAAPAWALLPGGLRRREVVQVATGAPCLALP